MPHAILDPAELHDSVPFGYSHTASIPAGSGLVLAGLATPEIVFEVEAVAVRP